MSQKNRINAEIYYVKLKDQNPVFKKSMGIDHIY